MPSYLDSLTSARANVAARLAQITASPKPSYTIDGENIQWAEYFEKLTNQLLALDQAVQRAQAPFAVYSRGRA